MKKLARLSLTLVLLASTAGQTLAQTRPRRVGGGSAPSATATRTPAPATSAPDVTTQAPTAPARKPTLEAGRPAPAASSQGQGGEVAEEVGEDEVVRVNASLVTVPVSVLDRDGRFISGLQKEDFRILEDGVEQQVAYFAPVEQPFTVALVIDTSGSTRFRLEDIQDAAIAFLDQLRPDDRVMVISFNDDVRILSEATNDRGALRDAIRRTHPGNGTRLYDAVDLVIRQKLAGIQGRKAVVLFTDGVDTTSKHASYQSTLEEAQELDAMIYPIQYDTYTDAGGGMGGGGRGGNWPRGGGGYPGRYPQRRPSWGDILGGIILGGGGVTIGRGPVGGGGVTIGRGPSGGGGGGGMGTSREEYERGGEYLRQLALETGGRHHDARELRNVDEAFTNIAEELRRQYSLGYYPSRQSQASERRQIRVRVKRPNLVVRARDSYTYRPGGGPTDTTAQDNNNQPRQAPELKRHFGAAGATNDER